MIGEILLAYRQIKQARARESAYKRMIGRAPDYTLIREIVNSAPPPGAVATITFVDGTKLDIRRADALDRIQELMPADKAASW